MLSQQTACNPNVLVILRSSQPIDYKGYKKLNFPIPFPSFRDILICVTGSMQGLLVGRGQAAQGAVMRS
jgi:hypothetical protein